MDPKDTKNNRAILIGLLLISLVFVFTLFRSGSKKSDSSLTAKEAANYTKISADDLKKRLAKENNIQLLDIRNYDDYSFEHIANSVNMASSEVPSGLVTANPTVIIANPDDEASTLKAFEFLKSKQFKDLAVLTGGIYYWKSINGSTISVGNPTSFSDQSKVTYITSDDLKKIVDDNSYPKYIIDVRPKQSFDSGHITGANNIFLDDLEKSKDNIPGGKDIVVYGDTEFQGFQAGVRLYDLNFFTVRVLKGGLADWKSKGFAVVK